MAFTNAWVETDPDGAVIFVSALDDSDRLIKNALRERLEGDPASPDLTGLIEVGSWSVAPKPRKGAARVYVDTQANILAFGATKREDGRLAVASDTGRLFHVATAAVAAIKLDAGDLGQGNISYSRLPTGGGVWANGGNLSITGGTTTVAGLINTGDELFTTAASRIIPGVTSLSLRNATNLADNLIITDAGLATFRNTVTISAGGLTVSAGGITVTGASTITGTLGGITTLTATTLAGTLSTATQPNVTSLGTLSSLTISGTLSAGATTLTASPLNLTAGAGFVLGTTDNNTVTVKTNALNRWQFDTSGNLIADAANGGTVQSRLGTSSAVAKHTAVLFTDFSKSTASTSEVSLTSFPLSANALSTNGQGIRFVIHGRIQVQNGQLVVKLGASVVLSTGILATWSFFWITGTIIRTGAAAQMVGTTILGQGATPAMDQRALTETLSGALTLDFRGSVTAGGTLLYDLIYVEYFAV